MVAKSILKNYTYNTLYQILTLLIPIVTTPYVSRILGADGIGIYSFSDSVTSYFVLGATMGISTYGQREISYYQEDRRKRSELFWNTKVLEWITSLIALVVYVIFAVQSDNFWLYMCLSLNIITVATDVTWLFQGMEDFKTISVTNMIAKLLNVAFVFLFVKQKDDVMLYALGMTIFMLAANLSLWLKVFQIVDPPQWKDIHPFDRMDVIVSLFIPTIAIQVYTVLDKTMIGIITGDQYQNGYYEQAVKISRMTLLIVTSLGTVLIPRIGYYFQMKEKEQVQKLIYSSYNFVCFLSIPLCLGLAGIANNFVPWFFGSGYDEVIPLLKILSALIIVVGMSNVTGMQFMIPIGKQNAFTVIVLIGAGANFVMNLVLIRLYGAIGAAIASVIAEICVTVLQMVYVRKEIQCIRIVRMLPKYLIAGIVMYIELIWLGSKINATMLHTMILICAGAATYMIMLFLLKDAFIMKCRNGIVEKIICKYRGEV